MGSRIAAIIFRLVVAGCALSAIAYQFVAVHLPRGYSPVNFFSYFTNLANLILAAVFLVSAVQLARHATPTTTQTVVRGAAVVYIAFVGVVFNTLLRGADLSAINPVVNVILHFITPIAGVLDWILWPPHHRLRWSAILWWMIFPAMYAVFSVVRGAVDGIYPYPFFDPRAVGGYGAVALYCAVMVVGFIVLSVAVRAVGNARNGRRAPQSP